MQPIVSIITVTKNCVATIERTIKSVVSVKSSDIEYIIIDGKSVDGTLGVINDYIDVVDVIISEDDSGIYNAMNKGAYIAKGKYILFVNGDDYILSDGFELAKDVLMKDSPEILSCQSEVFDECGNKGSVLKAVPWRLFFFNTIPHLSTFVSTGLQQKYKFRERFRIAADYDLFLRMFLKRHRFMLSTSVTAVHYRGGFSSDSIQSNAEIRQIRKDNLGILLYLLTRCIEWLYKFKKVFFAKFCPSR